MACNILRSSDPLLRLVRDHETVGVGGFLFKAARRVADDLGLVLTSGEEAGEVLMHSQ